MKKKGSGEVEVDDGYILIYAGVTNEYSKVEECELVSSRIIHADLQVSIDKITIIQIYAPTEDAGILDKELFYSYLH